MVRVQMVPVPLGRAIALGLVFGLWSPIHAKSDSPEFNRQSPSDSQPPTIAASRISDRVRLHFTGTLQTATHLDGPWTNVPSGSSPQDVAFSGSQRFFRSRRFTDIFDQRTPVHLIITGPLQRLFDKAFAGTPDGIVPPTRLKPYFDATVALDSFTVPVSARVRGNSSLQECPFPKLKFKVSRQDRVETPFAEAREIRIGTHCAEGGRGTIGRLRDETATYREALAYEVMETLGFASPRVRRAQIEYVDTTLPEESETVGWRLTRAAFILEDIDVVADRLGGQSFDSDELGTIANLRFSEQQVVDLEFLHALLGNWDYQLTEDAQVIWNTDVIQMKDGTFIPVAGDFDLAAWVTEVVRASAPPDYRPDLPALERQTRFELERIRGRASQASFDAAIDRYKRHRSNLEHLAQTAQVDDLGRANALRHLDVFYRLLDTPR